ncbi:MAG: BatD family protein [Saprospiraceae bacterium]|nr:BatD family protein [Saprospiraceae bacterium]MDW8484169.1 BatD family protein [Saprospiraceae bacterium]
MRVVVFRRQIIRWSWLWLKWLIPLAATGQADTALFEVDGPRREVIEGSRFEVSFVLKNQTALRFIPPKFSGLIVRRGPSEVRSAGFLHGKAYAQQAWVYELEAKKPGLYTIGSATVQTSQGRLKSQPFIVRVVRSPTHLLQQDRSLEAKRYFLVAEVLPEKTWLGQQILYRLRLYTQEPIPEADLIELPSFEGFYLLEKRHFDTHTQYERVGNQSYTVRTLYEASLFAQRAGLLSIGQARWRLTIERPGQGMFDATSEIVTSNSLAVQVNPLPEPKPENFCGVVGHYQWKISADKQALTTDDVLTLTVQIQGNGDSRRFVSPRFNLPEGLEAFDPEVREQEEYETGDEFVHRQTLSYAVLPQKPGTYLFMPEIAFFHPDSGDYRILRSEESIKLVVLPGPNFGKSESSLDTALSPNPPEELARWDAMGDVLKPWLPIGLIVLCLLILIGFAGFLWRKLRSTPTYSMRAIEQESASLTLPHRRELRAQLMQLRQSLTATPSETFYRQLLRWLETAVATYLQAPLFLLHRDEALKQLGARGVPSPVVKTIEELWEYCERAVYARMSPTKDAMQCWNEAYFIWKNLLS